MTKFTPEQGQMIGYCVVAESDLPLNAFGNRPSESKPIIFESEVFDHEVKAMELAQKLKRYGRAYVCEMRFHYEVL